MSEQVVNLVERRYNVETGDQLYSGSGAFSQEPLRTRIEWRFNRAFNTLDDAEAYAERISEDHEFVRVIDKGEPDA